MCYVRNHSFFSARYDVLEIDPLSYRVDDDVGRPSRIDHGRQAADCDCVGTHDRWECHCRMTTHPLRPDNFGYHRKYAQVERTDRCRIVILLHRSRILFADGVCGSNGMDLKMRE